MLRILMIISCCSLLFACSSGSDLKVLNKQIPAPANLYTDTHTITLVGTYVLKIYNIGEVSVLINTAALKLNNTQDEILTSECFNKLLNAHDVCNITLKVSAIEAGITELLINTNNGIYTLAINIDTTGEGVLATDTTILHTTKAKVVQIINKGSLPVTLSKMQLEKSNTTLSIIDNQCINTTLNSGSACQIILQASPTMSRKHTLFITTTNIYLKNQEVFFYEKTDQNKLNLYYNNVVTNKILITTPRIYNFVIKNDGTNDIHIMYLNLSNMHIGTIMRDTCTNNMLQATDTCNIDFQVNNDAHGDLNMDIHTLETLNVPFNLLISTNSQNLTFENNATDIFIHDEVYKNLHIINNNEFSVKVDKVEYDHTQLQLLSSNCEGIIKMHDGCNLNIQMLHGASTSNLKFFEFHETESQSLILHLDGGLQVISQPKNTDYYKNLPLDHNLYQVFSIINSTQIPQNFLVNLDKSPQINSFVLLSEIPNGFIDNPCLNDFMQGIVEAKSQCEIIVRTLNDVIDVSQLVDALFKISVHYESDEEVYTQTFKTHIIMHHEHREPVYNFGDQILPTAPNTLSQQCPQNPLEATALHLGLTSDGMHAKYLMGMLFTIEPDLTTIKIHSFINAPVLDQGCQDRVSYLHIKNNQFVLEDVNNKTQLIESNPVITPIDFNQMAAIYLQKYNNANHSFILPTSYCDDDNCVLNIKMQDIHVDGFDETIKFLHPYPTRDWDVLDEFYWEKQ